jgi:hypothetical protein
MPFHIMRTLCYIILAGITVGCSSRSIVSVPSFPLDEKKAIATTQESVATTPQAVATTDSTDFTAKYPTLVIDEQHQLLGNNQPAVYQIDAAAGIRLDVEQFHFTYGTNAITPNMIQFMGDGAVYRLSLPTETPIYVIDDTTLKAELGGPFRGFRSGDRMMFAIGRSTSGPNKEFSPHADRFCDTRLLRALSLLARWVSAAGRLTSPSPLFKNARRLAPGDTGAVGVRLSNKESDFLEHPIPCGRGFATRNLNCCCSSNKRPILRFVNPVKSMVGAERFELSTSCTPSKRASQATLRPDRVTRPRTSGAEYRGASQPLQQPFRNSCLSVQGRTGALAPHSNPLRSHRFCFHENPSN